MQTFKDIKFKENKENYEIILYDNYFFKIKKDKLKDFEIINENTIDSDMIEKREYNKLMFLIQRNLRKIKNKFNGKKTTVIFPNTYPLIGHVAFGLVDRGTNLIEIKPNTGCNFNCIYCSVSEGDDSRPRDFFIDPNYLIQEFKRMCQLKKRKVEAYIEPQGEPLLYPRIEYLIDKLSDINKVNKVILNTNGALLNKDKIDRLKEKGLDRFNISIDSTNNKLEREITNSGVNVNKTLELIKYSISKGIDVLMAPVWMKNINDEEIPKIIKFAKDNGAMLGIQNFLEYKNGRIPCKQMSFDTFYSKLEKLEKEYETRLILKPEYLDIYEDNSIEKVFKRKEVTKVEILGPGRLNNETIAKAKNRLVIIPNSWNKVSNKKTVRVKIIKNKHSINIGVLTK